MPTYAGIDLHSSNNYIGVINAKDKRLYGRRHDNEIKQVLRALGPYKKTLKGVVVESTYNWYWLVDGLQQAGFKVHLANPAAIQTYSGMKYTDDKWDAYWLAHMLRLNLLPKGYIYPKQQRPIRDMLRRRMMFVRQRTTQILSFQSMISRHRGLSFSGSSIKTFRDEFIEKMFDDDNLVFIAKSHMATIRHLDRIIDDIEASAKGNRKNGNRYLAWAYIEAAYHAIRCDKRAQRFFQRKMAKSNRALATKALANKLTKATYFMMRDRVPYDAVKLFQ